MPFFSFATAIAGVFLAAAVLAVFIPHIVDSKPVRARLIKELRNWTGGEVTLSGPVTVSSFFSVSVEAQDLRIDTPRKLSRITGITAGRIIARMSWMALVTGNVDFDKVKIFDAEIKMNSADVRDTVNALLGNISTSRQTPFGTLMIRNSTLRIQSSPDQPSQKVDIANIVFSSSSSSNRIAANCDLQWQGQPLSVALSATKSPQPPTGNNARTPLSLQLTAPQLNAQFDGEVDLSSTLNATGSVEANTPNMAELISWLGGVTGMIPQEAMSLKASLNVTDRELALRDAAFSLGEQTATGNLNIAYRTPLPEVEGSLAFNNLHLDSFLTDGARPPQAAHVIASSLSRVDLRISADTLKWQEFETGEAAFTLTLQSGALSLEVADLALLDGAVRGQITADTMADPIRVEARLSAENLSAGDLLEVLKQRDWLTGRANADVEADMEWGGVRPFWETADARVSVAITEGGQIRLDIPRLAETISGAAGISGGTLNGWDGVDFTRADFNELRFKLILRNGMLTCDNVELSSANDIVKGAGLIDLPKGSLDWLFSVSPRASGQNFLRTIGRTSVAFQPGFAIKGTVEHPTFSTSRRAKNISADQLKAVRTDEIYLKTDAPVGSTVQSARREAEPKAASPSAATPR